jgi:hypothetical protein
VNTCHATLDSLARPLWISAGFGNLPVRESLVGPRIRQNCGLIVGYEGTDADSQLLCGRPSQPKLGGRGNRLLCTHLARVQMFF